MIDMSTDIAAPRHHKLTLAGTCVSSGALTRNISVTRLGRVTHIAALDLLVEVTRLLPAVARVLDNSSLWRRARHECREHPVATLLAAVSALVALLELVAGHTSSPAAPAPTPPSAPPAFVQIARHR